MSRSRGEWREDETIEHRSYSISSMYRGEKAACFYHQPEEMLETTIALMEEALRRHEMCVLLSCSPVPFMVERLSAMGLNPRDHPGIVIIPWTSIDMKDYSHGSMTDQLSAFSSQARAQGYAGAMLLVDVPQELAEQLPDLDAWLVLDEVRAGLGITVVCMYDMASLSAALLLRSLTTYSIVITQGMLCHNFYCLSRGPAPNDPAIGLFDQLNQLRAEHNQMRLLDDERSRLQNINTQLQEEIVRRKMVEFALLQSQNNQSIMLDAMGDMVCMVDRQLRVTQGNQAFITFLDEQGLSTSFEGRTIYEVFPGLPLENRYLYEEVFHFGHITVTDETLDLKHAHLEAEVRRVPVLKGDAVDRIVVIFRLKPVEEFVHPGMWEFAEVLKASIRDPHGPLGDMMEHCPHPVLVHNINGDLYQFNKAACTMLGYSSEELTALGSTMALLDLPTGVKGHHRRYNYNGRISMPATVRRRNGSLQDVTCFFAFLQQGKDLKIILVLREK